MTDIRVLNVEEIAAISKVANNPPVVNGMLTIHIYDEARAIANAQYQHDVKAFIGLLTPFETHEFVKDCGKDVLDITKTGVYLPHEDWESLKQLVKE